MAQPIAFSPLAWLNRRKSAHSGTQLRGPRILFALTAAILLLAAAGGARAATFVVTKTADTNDGACDADCSLREAIIAANANAGADVITLPAGTYVLTILGANEDSGATGDLDITDDLTINGAGASTTIVDGAGLVRVPDRVFQVIGAVTVVFNGITIQNGSGVLDGGGISSSGNLTLNGCVVTGNRSGDQGGGIYVAGGNVNITDSTISNNSAIDDGAGEGGGIYIDRLTAVTVTRCTISGNTTDREGGGIANIDTLTIVNSTVNGNTASLVGGIYSGVSGQLTMTSCTVASNSGDGINNTATATLAKTIVANNTGSACNGPITDGGSNLQFPGTTCGSAIPSADPLLGPLANNGGPTQTQALLAGSPALNAAAGCPPPATDQRGVSRPQGPACEIGAFECRIGECGVVCPTITLSPATLPAGAMGTIYSQTITASPPGSYTFAVTAGALPAGLTLTPAGLLSGTPTANGNFSFTITATDTSSCQGSHPYTLAVSSGCKAPPAPVLSAAPTVVDSGRRVTLSWGATILPGQGTYVVQLSVDGAAFSDVTSIPAGSASTVTYVFTRTGVPGSYAFRVLAEPACGPTLFSTSNRAQVVVSGPCPFAPAVTGLTVTPSSAAPGEPFTLTWNPASGFTGGYDVLVSTDGGQTLGLLGTSATTSFSGTVAGNPGMTLTFAVEPAGCIYTQPSNFATLTVVNSSTCEAPGAVSGIVIGALGIVPVRAPAPTEFIDVAWNAPVGGTPPSGYAVRLNGETELQVTTNTAVFPPRGTDLDPIQAFVRAQACDPAVSGPEVASGPVALFLTPPAASFTVSSNPRTGEPVLFTDTSTPQATSWLWVFDDGATETSQSPTHTFTTAGPHQVSLVATNSAGSSSVSIIIGVAEAGATRSGPSQTLLRLDTSDPGRRRARVNIPGPDAVYLRIRSESADETVVFARFLDAGGRVLSERRLAVAAGQEGLYDLGAYGPRGMLTIELVSRQIYEAQVQVTGHAGAREIER